MKHLWESCNFFLYWLIHFLNCFFFSESGWKEYRIYMLGFLHKLTQESLVIVNTYVDSRGLYLFQLHCHRIRYRKCFFLIFFIAFFCLFYFIFQINLFVLLNVSEWAFKNRPKTFLSILTVDRCCWFFFRYLNLLSTHRLCFHFLC